MENNLTSNHVLEDAENQIREACEVLQREATRLRQQKGIDAISEKVEHFHSRRLLTSMLSAAVLRQVFKC